VVRVTLSDSLRLDSLDAGKSNFASMRAEGQSMRLRRRPAGAIDASQTAPTRCAACDEPVRVAVVFCRACASTVQRIVPAAGADIDSVAAFVYGGSIASAIARMKYEGRPDLARPLADLLWASIEPHRRALAGVVVVPVPLHPARFAERGFNQSALIGYCIARRLRASLDTRTLARTRDTPRQATLDRLRRAENVAGAFVVRRTDRVARRSIALIDDVRTTGATLEACSQALRRAGAAYVRWFVVAQADVS
jgi:ComF family protein